MRMNPWSRFRPILGDVCFVRLSVHTTDDGQLDDFPWRWLDNSNVRLREEIAAAVHETLGPEFEVRSLALGRGSIEILILIGTTYYAVAGYHDFVESIELMVRQLKDVVKRFFERAAPVHVSVSGSWTPGTGLAGVMQKHTLPAPSASWAATLYLIVSHAIMLAVILWLLVAKYRP